MASASAAPSVLFPTIAAQDQPAARPTPAEFPTISGLTREVAEFIVNTRYSNIPEDVAELALFLASERARHIQGAAIAVDGGQTTGLF